MSRSSFGFRRSFNSGRKISRDNRKHSQNQQQGPTGREHSELHEKRQRSRHDNSDADKATRSIFGDVPLTDTERRYLWAAQSGNLPALEILLQEAGTFNLSCRDYLGRTALQLAVLGEHYDCIELLLERSRLDVIEEGLLHAINTENVKICDMFLGHPVYSDQRSRMQMEFQHGFYEQEDSSSSFAPDITPVVLAAQCNNFDIVHMLIQKGFTIATPHNYFCLCTECYNHKNFDRVVHSKSRLNAYRGLASTAYLCLSCDDPICAAFELSRSLQKLANREKEHKNEYRKLSDKCKNFAVDLLDQCRTNEEVMAALHGGTDTRELSRIKMAIRYEQKKFISHASCQEHLASMWYSGASWFQHQNFPVKLFMVPCGVVFIPVTAIIYVFLPYSRVGKILKSPFMKFMNYICSYTAFLVLLFLGTQLSSFKSSHLFAGTEGTVNGLIIFYVLGMFWAECKQLWEEGVKGYFAQMWNYMDITMLALYTAGYSTEAVIYTKTQGYASLILHTQDEAVLNPQIVSKVLFSVANVMSFARIAYILPASETFGQLQISYGRMLQDVGKFIFIYFTVMIAFICGLTSLYSISRNDNFAGLLETTGTLFWAAFGMGNSKAPEILNEQFDEKAKGESGKGNSDGRQITDKEHLAVIEIVGYILYGVYILGAVVVLINMLIAMMSNTFEDIQKSEDCEWKFARAKLWISFIEQGTTLPIPFNIIPTPKSALKIARWFKDCICCGKRLHNPDWHSYKQYDQKYKAIMHRVVLRYIHKMKFEKKGESLKEEILDTREEVIFQLHSVYGRLAARLELLEKDILALSKSGHASQDGALSPVHPSLSYSRSVPAHPRDGDFSGHSLSCNPRESYLQRRRSCYLERQRREIPDLADNSRDNKDTSCTACNQGNQVATRHYKTKRRSSTSRTTKNNAAATVATTNTSSSIWSDDHSREEVARKVSQSSLNLQSLSSPEEYLPARSESYRQRLSPSCCSDHGAERRVTGEARSEQCERDDTTRDNRTRDGFSPCSRRSQSVIKESSLEDQMNTAGDTETSLSCPGRTGSQQTSNVQQKPSSHPIIDAPYNLSCGEHCKHKTGHAEFGESLPVTDETRQNDITCVQQTSNSRLSRQLNNATSSMNRLMSDARHEQASIHTTSLPVANINMKSQCPTVSYRTSTNNSNNKNIICATNSTDDCALKLSFVSQTSSMCPGSSDNCHSSSQNSSSSLHKSESDRKLRRSMSPLTLANEECLPTKPGRKVGRANHVFIPEVTVPDFPLDSVREDQRHEHADSHKDPVFYTRQSRVYRYSMSDLRDTDHIDSSPEHDPSDVMNRSGDDLRDNNSNKQTGRHPQMLPEIFGNYCVSQDKNMPTSTGFHSDKNPSANLASGRNPTLIYGCDVGASLLENTQTTTRSSSDMRAEDLTNVQPNSTANQRKSPMIKRESLPVILHANRSVRFQQMKHEDAHQYLMASCGLPDSQCGLTSFPGRPQHYNPSDMKLNSMSDEVNTQVSMIIPAMAANLHPFPIPSNDVFMRKLSHNPQHSPDSENATSSDSIKRESPKPKHLRSKKTSIVSLVRGRRSNKGSISEVKHNRSLSMSRYSSGSRNERVKTFHSQRSKEV